MFTPALRNVAGRLACALLFTTAMTAPIHAATFCVANGPALQVALVTANSNAADDEIRITTGTKENDSGAPYAWAFAASHAQDLHISGGWNSTCTLQQRDPRLTRLSGGTARGVLSVAFSGEAGGALVISNLTIRYGSANSYYSPSGIHVGSSGSATPSMTIENVRFIGNSTGGSGGSTVLIEQVQQAAGTYTLRNNVFEFNTGQALRLDLRSGATAYINNNTIVANELPNNPAASAITLGGAGFVWMNNNVVADSLMPTDLVIGPQVLSFLSHNHIGVLSGQPGVNQHMTTGDPQLELDSEGWWRPASGSPLQDSGHGFPAGGYGDRDFTGAARVQGVAIDRGAIETDGDYLFNDGFQDEF